MYDGGSPTYVTLTRGINLGELRNIIGQAVGITPTDIFKITLQYPTVRYPNSNLQYVALDIMDDPTVDLVFHVASDIPGVVPILYTEALSNQPRQEYTSFRQQTYHGGGSGGHCYDEDAVLLPANLSPHQNNDERDEQATSDTSSTSSMEDVDGGLDADETRGEEDYDIDNDVPSYKPPSLYTQDTWSNIVDPSPPLPTLSRAGWDGTSEFFIGQVMVSSDHIMFSCTFFITIFLLPCNIIRWLTHVLVGVL